MEPESTWDEIGVAFRSGKILDASRKELESYLFALASAQVLSSANQQRAYQMGETIRLLLTRKDSQEAERRATKIATVALIVALVSAVFAGLQVLGQCGLMAPAESCQAQIEKLLPGAPKSAAERVIHPG